MRLLLSFLLLTLFLGPNFLFADQTLLYDPLQGPNTYRSADNPNYWQNKLPHEGYWQQDVHYIIDADINEQNGIISGEEKLQYWNNSPDTLTFVYFHLYQNAFQPDSYLDALQRANGKVPRYGKYESQKLGTVIHSMKVEGKELKQTLDNTILRVDLETPLLPGQSITFDITFKTYFDKGSTRRRMKVFDAWGHNHYDGVHWYPRISVYDRKFGWTKDQHLGREFYGDFGAFDVSLTFSDNYVVGATGYLQNRKEVLPPELRAKLDIKNFKDKPWNEAPSEITPYDSTKRKTWRYHAENVHDFAFTADPTYRIGEAEWNGKTCIALAQEPHASGWQDAAEYTAKVIETYSTDFGMYVYHKMIVADARDGMEYPMLTLDGGKSPTYKGLLAHEIGHNWFYGQVGNNETYRAALDEGFTQFLTAWALTKIDGEFMPRSNTKGSFYNKYKRPRTVMSSRVFDPYMKDAVSGDAPPINIHSDGYNGALRHGGGYRHVYYKTATMLYNLQYTLGDELFLQAMKNYFNQWKIAHPYWEDFVRSVNKTTDTDLHWFFDQWIETGKTIDYKVEQVKRTGKDQYEITLLRKGRMQMPIDLSITGKDDNRYHFHIPNQYFIKETKAQVLPKWHGWDKLNERYTFTAQIPGGIDDIQIDPSGRLADINLLDNSKKLPLALRLDVGISNPSDRSKYEMEWRPDIWYNSFDGVKAGIHVNGNYMKRKHIVHLTTWWNSTVGQGGINEEVYTDNPFPVSFNAKYSTTLHPWMERGKLKLSGRFLDGLIGYTVGFEKLMANNDKLYVYFKSMYRYQENALDRSSFNYLIYPDLWTPDQYNNTLNLKYQHGYNYTGGVGKINIGLRSSFLHSDYPFSIANIEVINKTYLGKLDVRTRVFAQWGTGTPPAESALYFAGASPEEMMSNAYMRADAVVPNAWKGYKQNEVIANPSLNTTYNLHYGGGLNLRGYSGYFMVEPGSSEASIYKGNSGVGGSIEIDFDEYFRFKPKALKNVHLDTYVFGDAGSMYFTTVDLTDAFSELRFDAGLGLALTIKKLSHFDEINPLTIRFDMPLLLSHIPFGDIDPNDTAGPDDHLQFRWVLGINRSF